MNPVLTDDPTGDMPAQEKMSLACQVVADRREEGEPLTNVEGVINATFGNYDYHFLIQEVINFCTFS